MESSCCSYKSRSSYTIKRIAFAVAKHEYYGPNYDLWLQDLFASTCVMLYHKKKNTNIVDHLWFVIEFRQLASTCVSLRQLASTCVNLRQLASTCVSWPVCTDRRTRCRSPLVLRSCPGAWPCASGGRSRSRWCLRCPRGDTSVKFRVVLYFGHKEKISTK